MTPEEKRKAIAEACGWTAITSDLVGIPPGSRGTADAKEIPNYLCDSVARLRVEEKLGREALERICRP
jgi:hypothetical protein